ncbi:hypothetical protein PHET_02197 [Paragonimus heterotremus]|uniref:SET domain-containing protein n=1 Tax=Paragonimus heterotremus TaxID=100268 RepID=A0A8J4TLH4_9TREM|nr:hypothetical protein PHET_02197 [Paragonimus heterotremus]
MVFLIFPLLGLVPYTNLMDNPIFHPIRHTLEFSSPLNGRQLNGLSAIEPDPILEDTPDIPDETDEIDYTVHPPEVGQNVLVNEIGSEVALCTTPQKQKRVLCSFSSQRYAFLHCYNKLINSSLPDGSDSDEYPFEAITYGGESIGCVGLPYNDHNYTSEETPPRVTQDDDRLSLLAKLALAKDETPTSKPSVPLRKPLGQPGMGLIITSDEFTSPNPCFKQLTTTSSHSSPTPTVQPARSSSSNYGQENHSFITSLNSSLITANSRIASVGGRAFVLASAPSGVSPTLQVHRISSSLTPHIVLRTGVPALQISTTAPRVTSSVSSDLTGGVRCVCGYTHSDGILLQCEKCKTWQHSECVSLANDARIPASHICDLCTPRLTQASQIASVQRHKLTGFTTNTNANIRISRTSALGVCSNPSRILVKTAAHGNSPPRPVHLCLPTPSTTLTLTQSTSQNELTVPANTADVRSGNTRYLNLITQPTSLLTHTTQPVRSSKRKQDLTLSGSSGLECVSTSATPDELDELTSMLNPYVPDSQSTSFVDDFVTSSVSNGYQQNSVATPTTSTTTQITQTIGSSLHRLLMHDREQLSFSHLDVVDETQQASPSSTMSSDSLLSPTQTDAYEETPGIRLSARFYHKLQDLFSGSPTTVTENVPYNKEDGLVASEDLYPRDAIVEYRGLCMLLSEYNELHDYRKHYNPFVLFYKNWSKLALCVDARKFGNEARFIRRSCTPNCEVRHFLSNRGDVISGTNPRIQLVLFATRPITRSAELTLPFDFDYTTCRYLVKCACARKACPVARWFRQASQPDDGRPSVVNHSIGSSASSLLYTRKLPYHSRGSGPGSRPRGWFATTVQDSYSDILSDEYEVERHRTGSNCVDDRVDAGDVHSVSRLRPHRTFRRVSHISDSGSSCKLNGVSKSIRSRGRSRGGRQRGTGRPSAMSKGRGLFSKVASRGRPRGQNRQLTYIQQRRSGYFRGRTQKNLNLSPKSAKADQGSVLNNSRGRTKLGAETNVFCDSPLARQLEDRVRNAHRGNVRRRFSVSTSDQEDLDVDTEPEYIADIENTTFASRPSSDLLDSELKSLNAFRSKPAKSVLDENSSFSNSNKTAMQVGRNSLKMSKSDKPSPRANNEQRGKWRHGSSREVHNPPSRKITHTRIARFLFNVLPTTHRLSAPSHSQKSREEIWMAEVLRRIERMEKKEQQNKIRSTSSEVNVVLPEFSVLTAESITASIPDCLVSTDTNVERDFIVDSCIGDTGQKADEDYIREKECDANLNEIDAKVSSTLDPLPAPTAGLSPGLFKCDHLLASLSPCSKEDGDPVVFPVINDCPEKSGDGNSPTASTSSLDDHKPVPRSLRRRRRSQTALLSDGLSSGLTAEQNETREDRWLKSQLRRIAELEINQSTRQSASELLETTRDGPTPPCLESCTSKACSSDSVFTALKEVSTNDITDGFSDVSVVAPGPPHEVKSEQPSNIAETNNHRRHEPVVSFTKQKHFKVTQMTNDAPRCGSHKSNDGQLGHHHSLNSAEVDCELIVYRTQEKDPMAKFSRTRSIDLPTSMHATAQENTPPMAAAELSDVCNVVASASTSIRTGSSTHSTPRPTKKRWLCQALMEKDNDLLVSGLPTPMDKGLFDRITDGQFNNPEDQRNAQSTISSTSSSVCPVNPKKRIISQFSGLTGEMINSNVVLENPSAEHVDAGVDPVDNTSQGSTCLADSEAVASTCICPVDVTNCHSTPLPPKKATVKQQTEEMRKVRVSLSEYRRRRGLLSSAPTSTLTKSVGETEQRSVLNDDSLALKSLEINLPPALLSPSKLLDEIPKIYSELHLPEKTTTRKSDAFCPTTTGAVCLTSNTGQVTCSNRAFDEFPGKLTIPVVEDRTEEHGPRTPSEPPDDEDFESSEAVYVKRRGKPLLTSIIEESEVDFGESLHRSSRSYDSRRSLTNAYEKTSSTVEVCNRVDIPLTSNDAVREVNYPHTDHISPSSLSDFPAHFAKHRKFSGDVTLDDRSVDRGIDPPRPRASSLSVDVGSSVQDKPSSPLIPPPPPPPPPPMLSCTSGMLVDLTSTRTKTEPSLSSTSYHRHSGSKFSYVDVVDNPSALDYFIKRDQEIRHWQQLRSMKWERKRSAPKHHSFQVAPVGSERRSFIFPPIMTSSRQATTTSDSSGRNLPRFTEHPLDVEKTLCRLYDCLRSQIDRTKPVLTSRGFTPVTDDRTSSTVFPEHNGMGRIAPCAEEKFGGRSSSSSFI